MRVEGETDRRAPSAGGGVRETAGLAGEQEGPSIHRDAGTEVGSYRLSWRITEAT